MGMREPLGKIDVKSAFLSRQPVFSDESLDTEYTSSSSEAVLENGNLIEPKSEGARQPVPVPPPHENLAVIPNSDVKSDNLEASLQARNPPLESGVVLSGRIVTPSFTSQRVGAKRGTTMKEIHDVDKNGKPIVVLDLGDSDDESEVPLTRRILCESCKVHKQHTLQQEVQVTKAAEKDEVRAPTSTIVVDLSATSSQIKHAHVAAGKVPMSHTGEMVHCPSKAHGKQVEVEMDFSKKKIMADSLKAEGSQVATNFDREHVASVMDSSIPLQPRVLLSSKVLEALSGKVRETVLPAAEESEDEASTLSEDYRRGHDEGHHVEVIPPDWSPGILCDLCGFGPSLSLGAWYAWCCGNPFLGCSCPVDEVQRKKRTLMWKGGRSGKNIDPPYPWSGMVHKLCGLWSAEVYEHSEFPWRYMKLEDAVRRSRKIKCADPDCGLFGATLGCRVASCRRSYHYPCADRLSASVKLRMWEGLMKPVACKEHRHVNGDVEEISVQEPKKEPKKRKRGRKSVPASSGAGSSKPGVRITNDADVIQIGSSDEDGSPHGPTGQEGVSQLNTSNSLGPGDLSRFLLTRPGDTSGSRNAGPAYLGKNLLCRDFSGGLEPIEVPCTNDVDDERPPRLKYITKSSYKGQPLGSKTCGHPLLERQAKACNGCALHDPDDPSAPLSVHIPFQMREHDFRQDWQRERMYGRLPYDKYARVVIGTDHNELVECNDRCKCGDSCINREMQKGLRTPIELYKTVNKGWAVRALVPIPRGRFVIEYVGEMLTQDVAQSFGRMYDEIKRSYLYDLDYPESKRMPDFTLDGFNASNVARFINHSCDANLKIYRVYVETTYKWLSHIGMYAMRDIESGEELSYDYNYGRHELQAQEGKHTKSEAEMKQRIEFGNDSTHIKCYCGAKNCREWLWRPMPSEDDSEDDDE